MLRAHLETQVQPFPLVLRRSHVQVQMFPLASTLALSHRVLFQDQEAGFHGFPGVLSGGGCSHHTQPEKSHLGHGALADLVA